MQIKAKLEKARDKLSEHKAEIAICGFGLACAGVTFLVGKKYFPPTVLPKSLAETSSTEMANKGIETAVDTKIVDISPFIRNLHEGWSSSAENLELARQNGISLLPGQSYIPEHSRHYLSA